MFYFRATKSFHDNRRPAADSRDDTSRTAPGSTTLLGFRRTAPHRRPGAVTLPRVGLQQRDFHQHEPNVAAVRVW
jgi:hypothetical protein